MAIKKIIDPNTYLDGGHTHNQSEQTSLTELLMSFFLSSGLFIKPNLYNIATVTVH